VRHRSWHTLPPGADPYRQLVDSVLDYAIYMLDREGVIRSWNAGAERIKGYQAAEIIGQPLSVLYTPGEIGREHIDELLTQAAEQGRVEQEGRRVRRDGTHFWANTVITALFDRDGHHYGYAVITRDLTEKIRQDEELRRTRDRSRRFWTAAISDALTGAFNRRYLMTHLAHAMERGETRVASLLLFDIDHFKEINDAQGHDAGDLALKRVADIARQMSRESDMLFRHGGDEFVLYLPGVGLAGARVIAQRLREAVAHSAPAGGSVTTVSIGVAERRPGDTVETWLSAADRALYAAKQAGRNRVA
jgi:diguanylate cyclase (GGDEF)-like protein/PAS domain S-box-containing protein